MIVLIKFHFLEHFSSCLDSSIRTTWKLKVVKLNWFIELFYLVSNKMQKKNVDCELQQTYFEV